MIKSGLKPISFKDHRTYDFHRTFGTAPSTLKSFSFDTLGSRPNQDADGLAEACTAYSQNDIASNEDGILYDDYDFTYRNTLNMMDAEFGEPCDMMKALDATTVYGVKKKTENAQDALGHRRAPYFIVKKLNDYLDGLQSAMLVKQGCLSLATPWYPSFEFPNSDGTVPSPNNWADLSRATWHDWEACGIEVINGEPYLASKSWQGAQFGQKGMVYFSREQVNNLLSTKGAGAFGQKRAKPEDIKTVKMTLIETLISYMNILLKKLNPSPMTLSTPNVPVAPVLPVQEAVEAISAPHTLLWDTPENVRHSVRVMCDESGLSVSDKNTLCACVEVESNFNTQAVHVNKDANGKTLSTDYGIVQINDFYHIGPGKDFPSADYVLSHPEECVAYMIKMMKAGKLDLWVSFSSGLYKKYL